jgi:NAD(P)H-flavin reductase/ferredoxin
MPKITCGGQSCESGELSVLDSLTAQGVHVPSSCRVGICQACLMRAVKGKVPAKAQSGLKPSLLALDYFLACACYPQEDLEVALAEDGLARIEAQVSRLRLLSPHILGVWLAPSVALDYRAGQFIRLYKDEATSRSYSLASLPAKDEQLELHVRRVPGGLVSGWMFDQLRVGDTVAISEAMGNCIYVPGRPQQNMLLVGTGSGLAPLYCIAREAMGNGHSGEIRVYHGSRDENGIYLAGEMQRLAEANANFHYLPCVSAAEPQPGWSKGRALDLALNDHPDLSNWRVYLCGNPGMVESAKKRAFMAGASMRDIHADAFQ